jgi:hypothetical protein
MSRRSMRMAGRFISETGPAARDVSRKATGGALGSAGLLRYPSKWGHQAGERPIDEEKAWGQNPIGLPLPAPPSDSCVSFFCRIYPVLTSGRDHGRLVHAIQGVRATPLFLAGRRITRIAWTRSRDHGASALTKSEMIDSSRRAAAGDRLTRWCGPGRSRHGPGFGPGRTHALTPGAKKHLILALFDHPARVRPESSACQLRFLLLGSPRPAPP